MPYKDHSKNLAYFKVYNKTIRKGLKKLYPWKSHLYDTKYRCENIHNTNYKNYGGKGIKFFLTMEQGKELWFRDKAHAMKKPSIDRIKSNQDYIFDNCRFIEHGENTARKQRKIILQYDLNNNFIKEWESTVLVFKNLHIPASSISGCLNGRLSNAGGFKWKYKGK